MSNLSTQPYRGTRDFYPEDQALQTYIFDVWRIVCQSYGFEEYNTPTVEPLDIYTAKTSDEIVKKQTYSFTDRGNREVTIRPEMTPSVARLVASKRQEWGYPLRLFSIPNCMRYERPQKGRLREFWQLNADIFGLEGISADIEIIQLANSILKAFGARDDMYVIKVNSRKLLNDWIDLATPKVDPVEVVRLIDNFHKIDEKEFSESLSELVDNPDGLLDKLNKKHSNKELKDLIGFCKQQRVTAEFDPTVVRGFDYYTDIVFEVFDRNPDNNRSMFGGGRYDNLVGAFGTESVASTGFGMGDATLVEFLTAHDLLPDYEPATDVYMILIGDVADQASKFASTLRNKGVNVAVDFSGKKLDKQIKTAVKHRVPFALFVGPEEIKSNVFKMKNLTEESEYNGDLAELAQVVLSNRSDDDD